MLTKTAYRDRKYLFIGISMGALFCFLGSFSLGFYFRGMNTGDFYNFYISFVWFILLIILFVLIINYLDKKSK